MKKVQKPEAGSQKLRDHCLIALLVVFGLMLSPDQASAKLTIKTNHNDIKINFFYHGSTVSVSGTADPATDLIIKIASPDGHETLRQKGKVGGLLWMNVGTLQLEQVPQLYSIHSTKKIEDILDRREIDEYVIGYPALSEHAEITPSPGKEDKSKWFNEFIKYKEASNLYATSSGKIEAKEKDGKQHYYILLDWPYQAPPGEYLVTVYAVRNKKIVEKAESKVTVEQTGIVKTLSSMARNNAVLYGLISIISALAAGFGVGLIFRKSGGAH